MKMDLNFCFKVVALLTCSLGVDVQAITSDPNDMKFYLFANPSDTTDAKTIVYNDRDSFLASSMNCSNPTKIIIHGFGGNGTIDSTFPANVKHEYLKLFERFHYNIITVDYWKLSAESCPDGQLSNICYPAAVQNVPIVGGRIGEFILWLIEICDLRLDLVHLVPHSLGVPVAGWAGITVSESGTKISRISALDPAGPLFYLDVNMTSTDIRHLHPGDAMFTDVYHTSSQMGNFEKQGIVDFYINGAVGPQPGCSSTNLADPLGEGCNHARSTEYWANSIAAAPDAVVCVCDYIAGLVASTTSQPCCEQEIVIGEYCNSSTTGTFYLTMPAP